MGTFNGPNHPSKPSTSLNFTPSNTPNARTSLQPGNRIPIPTNDPPGINRGGGVGGSANGSRNNNNRSLTNGPYNQQGRSQAAAKKKREIESMLEAGLDKAQDFLGGNGPTTSSHFNSTSRYVPPPPKKEPERHEKRLKNLLAPRMKPDQPKGTLAHHPLKTAQNHPNPAVPLARNAFTKPSDSTYPPGAASSSKSARSSEVVQVSDVEEDPEVKVGSCQPINRGASSVGGHDLETKRPKTSHGKRPSAPNTTQNTPITIDDDEEEEEEYEKRIRLTTDKEEEKDGEFVTSATTKKAKAMKGKDDGKSLLGNMKESIANFTTTGVWKVDEHAQYHKLASSAKILMYDEYLFYRYNKGHQEISYSDINFIALDEHLEVLMICVNGCLIFFEMQEGSVLRFQTSIKSLPERIKVRALLDIEISQYEEMVSAGESAVGGRTRRNSNVAAAASQRYEKLSDARFNKFVLKGNDNTSSAANAEFFYSTSQSFDKSMEPSNRSTRSSARVTTKADEKYKTPPPPSPPETNNELFKYPLTGGNFALSVVEHDKHRLNEGLFLNDSVVLFYIRYFEDQNPHLKGKVKFFSSFFYSYYSSKASEKSQSAHNYEKVKKWTKEEDIFSYDYLVVPICEHLHWYLAIISNPKAVLNAAEVTGGPENDSFDLNVSSFIGIGGGGLEGDDTIMRSQSQSPEMGAKKPLLASSNTDVINLGDDDEDQEGNEKESVDEVDEDEVNSHDEDQSQDDISELQIIKTTTNAKPTTTRDRKREEDVMVIGPGPHSSKKLQKADMKKKKADKERKKKIEKAKGRCVIFILDSLEITRNKPVSVLKEYLKDEARERKKAYVDTKLIIGKPLTKVPKQPNHCDCGVYLLQYIEYIFNEKEKINEKIEYLLSGDRKTWFTSENVQMKRGEIMSLMDNLESQFQNLKEKTLNPEEPGPSRKKLKREEGDNDNDVEILYHNTTHASSFK